MAGVPVTNVDIRPLTDIYCGILRRLHPDGGVTKVWKILPPRDTGSHIEILYISGRGDALTAYLPDKPFADLRPDDVIVSSPW